MKKIGLGAGIFVIEDFLTSEECESYINVSESHAWEDAAIQTPEGHRIFVEVRNNSRIIFDDESLAREIYEKARPHLPDVFGDEWLLVGLNERFRYYKYSAGEYFKWHKDGFYIRSDDEMSQLTLLIYLNDDYEGGETEFRWDVIKPKKGMALVFPHLFMHQGKDVISGVKYVLRTDVMYTRVE